MILLKEFFSLCNYKITGGWKYQWHCFGPNAYALESEGANYFMQIVFDTENQIPYCAEICDYRRDRAYRIINPFYRRKHDQECIERRVNDTAWDCVKWIDLETKEDFIEKATAIQSGLDYDTNVQVPLDLDKEELHELMLRAHERNQTLNELVREILEEFIEEKNSTVAQR